MSSMQIEMPGFVAYWNRAFFSWSAKDDRRLLAGVAVR